jgi:hypothetical protein
MEMILAKNGVLGTRYTESGPWARLLVAEKTCIIQKINKITFFL